MAVRIERQVVLTKVPLNGYFKYKDEFQLFPLDVPDLPKVKFQKHFPNVLEFTVNDDVKVKIPEQFKDLKELMRPTSIETERLNQILRLLTAFSNHHFFQYTEMQGNFGLPVLKDDLDESFNEEISVWCMKVFYHPKWSRHYVKGKFTQANELFPEISCGGFREYFMNNPNLDTLVNRPMTFTCLLPLIFDAYYNQDDEVRSYIDVAASYIVATNEIRNTRKTLSWISCFTALETMVNLEFRGLKADPCKECGQPRFSVRKKFRDYLLKYVSSTPASKKKFNTYYDFRSKVIHTGMQLKTEKLFPEITDEESTKEWIEGIEILQLTRIAIMRWLIVNYQINFTE